MKVIIVGAGIAGLAAAVYARQSGFEVEVFEQHSIPGGNSTSWRRGGYLFEGGMHWLVGSGEKAPLNRAWREVGALQANNPIRNKDPFLTYVGETGPVHLYRDPRRLKQHLLHISPQDAAAIRTLVRDIRTLGRITIPLLDIEGVQVRNPQKPGIGMLPMLTALPRMQALGKISVEQYTARFEHAGIREALRSVMPTSFSASSLLVTLGGLAVGDGGYPQGGSLRMAQNIADRIVALGGSIRYKSPVQRLLVRDGRARGVVAGDVEYEADAVLLTCDTLAAIEGLIAPELREPWMDEMRRDTVPLNSTFVCLGVRADLDELPLLGVYPLREPLTVAGAVHTSIGFNNYAGFEGYAPPGCTALTTAFCEDGYDYWAAARADGSYKEKKRELALQVVERLAQVIPATAGKVEVTDVATPLTYERYCGTWRGSWMSVMGAGSPQRQYPAQAQNTAGLYFAGQRLMLPGGLPVALMTARTAVQHICRDNQTTFQGEIGD